MVGTITASWAASGKIPDAKELFTIQVKAETLQLISFFKIQVSWASSIEVPLDIWIIMRLILSLLTVSNSFQSFPWTVRDVFDVIYTQTNVFKIAKAPDEIRKNMNINKQVNWNID